MIFDKKIYMEFDGEMKEVVPYIDADIGHSHIESIDFMLKEDYDQIDDIAGHEVCTDELVFLSYSLMTHDDLKDLFNEEE